MKKVLLLLWMLLIANLFVAEGIIVECRAANHYGGYTFHHFSTDDGLLNNEVKSIYRDTDGFLWIGTVVGLNRYDGYSFRHYNHNRADYYSLADDDVISINEDADKNLWIKGRTANSFYNRGKDRIENAETRLSEMGIKADGNSILLTDGKGDLWVITGKRIECYSFSTARKTEINSPSDIVAVTCVGNTIALIGGNGRLAIYDRNKSQWQMFPLPNSVPPLNWLRADRDNNLWAFSNQSDNLYCFDCVKRKWSAINIESGNNRNETNFVRDIRDDGNGNVWIATDHKGVFIYNKSSKITTNLQHESYSPFSLKDNSIASLWIDKDNTIYIGYVKSGLSCHSELFQQFTNYVHRDFRNISTIIEDKDGNLWIGTDGFGLYCKQPRSNDILKHIAIPGNIVVCLHEDAKGRIWIGTYLHGLLCYDKGRITQFTTNNSGISDNSVYSLQSDRTGKLWIGTLWGYLQTLNPETGKFESSFNESKDQTVAVSMSYDGGSVLYAGMISGLAKINIMTGKCRLYYGNAKGDRPFGQRFMQTVFKDSRGNIWLGHNQGVTVWHLDSDDVTYLTRSSGLVDDVIRGIAEDDSGNIWIATSNGCSVVSLQKDKKGIIIPVIRNYTTKDGLLINNLSRHSILNLRDGSMLLGSIDGYSIFEGKKTNGNVSTPSKIQFVNMTIGGKTVYVDSLFDGRRIMSLSLNSLKEITLDYSDRMIGIEFSSMNMVFPEKIEYEYRLEGVDDGWIRAEGNKVLFSQLPSGTYTLYIRSTDANGVWQDNAAKLKIKVTPPFWASVYAYIFYILAFACGVFLYRRHLIKSSRRKLEEQKLRAEQQQAMRMNEMKLRFFTNVSHDFRTPLTLILTPLHVMIEETKDSVLHKKLSGIAKNAEQLLALVNQLLDFRKLDVGAESLKVTMGNFSSFVNDVTSSFREYAIERNIDLKVDDNAGKCFCQFDRDKIRKVITNLLSNAFKYTPDGGNVTVTIFKTGNNIGVSVADSGIGISDNDKKHVFERFFQTRQDADKTGSGIGLHIVNEYIRLHNGSLLVDDNHPCGSVFTFTIPYRKAEEKETEIEETVNTVVAADAINDDLQENEDKKPTVLVVDDIREMCEFLSDNLRDNYEVLTASNGVEALSMMKMHDVSLVVSDVMMPEMDGMELCRRIKTDLQYSHIPVILLTARAAEESKVEGLELGADDYITKPFNFNVLKLRIDKFLEWTRRSHKKFVQKMDVAPSEITITKLDEELIAKAIKIVEANIIDSEFSVEDFSREIGMTRGHLYKKLMSITGKGPSDFIRIIRLKRAKQYLRESQYRVSEIAYKVGFNSPKIFTKNFKAEFGILPSEYVKQEQQE